MKCVPSEVTSRSMRRPMSSPRLIAHFFGPVIVFHHLVAHDVGGLWNRCKSEPQMAQLVTFTIASCSCSIEGSETVSQRTSFRRGKRRLSFRSRLILFRRALEREKRRSI